MSIENTSELQQGSTPSRLATETPGWVRIVGLVGVVATLAGLLMYLYNAWIYTTVFEGPTADPTKGQTARVYPLALWFLALGTLLMLIQMSRERDTLNRRIYGMAGLALFCLGVLFTTHTLVSEGVRSLLSANQESSPESAIFKGRWAGLAATLVMAFILMLAWVAPFVRAVSKTRVSLLGFGAAWIKEMGQPLVASTTLFGFLAVGVLAVIAFFLKDPLTTYVDKVLQYRLENRVPYGLCSYAVLFMLLGLPFMLIQSNSEDKEAWSKSPTSVLGITGILFALFGLMGFVTDLLKVPDYTLPYGFMLSLLGLLFILLYISQRNSSSASSVTLAKWTGYVGLIVLVVASLRSLIPALIENEWVQNTFSSLENLNFSSYLVPNGFFYILLGGLFLFVGKLFHSESRLMVMTRRELAAYFTSPIGYIVMGATVVVAWFVFNSWLNEIVASTNFGESVPEPVVAPYFFDWFVILFMLIAIPMTTMRLMSEENRSGTVEVMLTAPVNEFSIVMSKFIAGWLFMVIIYLLWSLYPIFLRIAGQEGFDYRPMISSMLGLCLVTFGFVAMGLFFSTITKNQIVALLLTFAGMLALFALWFIERNISGGRAGNPNSPVAEFLRFISFVHHIVFSFSRGKVELKHFVFHLSFGAFWLFLTMRVLESRKWR
jgi:ABC-2 type transport system permease protein